MTVHWTEHPCRSGLVYDRVRLNPLHNHYSHIPIEWWAHWWENIVNKDFFYNYETQHSPILKTPAFLLRRSITHTLNKLKGDAGNINAKKIHPRVIIKSGGINHMSFSKKYIFPLYWQMKDCFWIWFNLISKSLMKRELKMMRIF